MHPHHTDQENHLLFTDRTWSLEIVSFSLNNPVVGLVKKPKQTKG